MFEEFFKEFPVIKSNSFILRELDVSDAEEFLTYMTNMEVERFLSDEDKPVDLASARSEVSYWGNLFRTKRSIYWGIEKDSKLIGTAGFNNWSKVHNRCEISYDLSYAFWGKGMMTEVIKLVTNFAFEKMKVNRVQATVAIDNYGSIRVLEKNGYNKEGVLAKFGILNKVIKDFYIFSKVR